MTRPPTLLAVAWLAAAPLAAHASDMSYTFVEGGFAQADIDGVSSTLDGFYLRGSAAFTDHLHLSADYVDVSKSGVDFQQYSVGLGGRYPLSPTLDLTGRVAWVRAEAGVGPFSASDDGYGVTGGLRGRLGERFELEGNVSYFDVGSGSGDTAAGVAARYFFTDSLAVTADFQRYDDVNLWGLGARVNFGR